MIRADLPDIPLKWIVAAILALGAFIGWRFIDAKLTTQAKTITDLKAVVAQQKAELAFEYITRQVTTEYVDRIQVVRERGQTIIKEVPVYVPVEADNACDLRVGFVRLHDAAAQGVPLPGPAGAADAEPAGVALSAVAETVADNYTTCHGIRAQLTSLQSWVKETHDVP